MGGQTTVSAGGQAGAIAGQLADVSQPHDVVSGINEATTQIPFGFGLRDGMNERGYLLATGFSGVIPVKGIALHGFQHVPAGNPDADGNYQGDLGGSGLLQYAGFDVLRQGPVWLPVENTITKGMRGWCRGVATGSTGGGVGIWAGSSGAPGAAVGPIGFGASYHVDCSKQVEFRSASQLAADGTTVIALAQVDFNNTPY